MNIITKIWKNLSKDIDKVKKAIKEEDKEDEQEWGYY